MKVIKTDKYAQYDNYTTYDRAAKGQPPYIGNFFRIYEQFRKEVGELSAFRARLDPKDWEILKQSYRYVADNIPLNDSAIQAILAYAKFITPILSKMESQKATPTNQENEQSAPIRMQSDPSDPRGLDGAADYGNEV